MSLLSLTLATWDYDRVKAIIDGRVEVEGCDLRHISVAPEECFHRAWAGEFDAAELGICSYLTALTRGTPDFIAIPVFPSRIFRHSSIYVRSDRKIETPNDLRGKRIGVPQYDMAVAVWVRGFLQDDFGIHPEDVEWYQGGLETPGRRSHFSIDLPERIRLRNLGDGQTLSAMLADGELDAIVTARAPSCFESGHPDVARLFGNFRDVETDYYRRTRIFPIMHVIGIRRSLVERNPWLPVSLLKSFTESKRIAEAELREFNALKLTLPWVAAEVADTERLMGKDYWPYGVEGNRATLDAIVRYCFEQHIIPRPVSIDEMFAPTTLKSLKI